MSSPAKTNAKITNWRHSHIFGAISVTSLTFWARMRHMCSTIGDLSLTSRISANWINVAMIWNIKNIEISFSWGGKGGNEFRIFYSFLYWFIFSFPDQLLEGDLKLILNLKTLSFEFKHNWLIGIGIEKLLINLE